MEAHSYNSRGHQLEDEFVAYARELGGDVEGRKAGGDYLMTTHALYHDGPLSWDFVPKVVDGAAYDLMRDAAETMYGIMDSVTRRCVEDPSFMARFRFPEILERIIKLPTGYDCQIPLARVDIFLNEDTGDYWFCEVNTDGSSGMTLGDEVARAITTSQTYERFAAAHPGIHAKPTLDVWARELLATYASWQQPNPTLKPATPEVVVVDYTESVGMDEVKDFIEHWAAQGVQARFSDIRDLRIAEVEGEPRLVDSQGPIACLWRRAVTGEIARKPCPGSEALADAAERNLTCIIGSFRTWVSASKAFFAVLHEPDAADFLTPEQLAFVKAHVPETHFLDESSDLARYAQRERWIAKPEGGYNSEGVIAGSEVTDEEWMTTLADIAKVGGIIQAYAPQYATPTLPGGFLVDENDPLPLTPANNMEGLFLFNGKFSGVFSRCGYSSIIGEFQGRLNQGVFYVNE